MEFYTWKMYFFSSRDLIIWDTNRETLRVLIVLFVETPRKFITATIFLRGVSTNKTIIYIIAMQTHKELITSLVYLIARAITYCFPKLS
jgi:hypothetical protein